MRQLLLIIFLASSIYATTIVNHMVSVKSDSISIIFVFDKPYKGNIHKKMEEKSAILTLDNVRVKKGMNEDIFSDIIQKVSLISYKDKAYIELIGRNKFNLSYLKSSDNYGIKIKVVPYTINTQKHTVIPKKSTIKKETLKPLKAKELESSKETKEFKTKSDSDIMMSFIKVLLVLGLLAALLYLLKMFIANKNGLQGGWLFNNSKKDHPQMKILYQKMIDSKTKTALLEFNNTKYLVLIGSEGNLLLDKYDSELKPIENDSFDELLEKNTKKLDDYINLQNEQFNSYKQRASRDVASSM